MRKKGCIIISVIAIFVTIISSIFYFNNSNEYSSTDVNKTQLKTKAVSVNKEKSGESFITVTTKFFDKNTEHTKWSYQYSDKYDEIAHQWDFKNADVYILRNDKWEIETPSTSSRVSSPNTVATVKLDNKNKGAYLIQVMGTKYNKEAFYDQFEIACSTNQEVKSVFEHEYKVENDSIILTTEFFNNDTKNTVWTYQYTDKYDETKHQWDFKNTNLYVLRNGKWETTPLGEVNSSDNTASIRLPKKSTGAYHVEVNGSPNTHGRLFYDKFDIDCSKLK